MGARGLEGERSAWRGNGARSTRGSGAPVFRGCGGCAPASVLVFENVVRPLARKCHGDLSECSRAVFTP